MTSYLGVIRTVMLADTSQFNLAIRGATKEVRNNAMVMRSAAQSLVGIGAALNLGITIPTLLAARSITKVGVEFDSNMMKIRNVTNMTADTFARFKDAQKGLSSNVAMSQNDLAKIAYIGGQAQLKSVEQLTAFQKAIADAQLAYPSDAPIEAVASGFTSVINSFGIQASGFEKTMAEMIQTINLGTISWEEYANTIKQVVGVSSSLRDAKAFQKLNVAMAMATQGGVSGKSVATAIRNIYTRIWKENSQQKSPLNIEARRQGYKSASDMFERGADKDLATYIKMVTNNGKNATGEVATELGMMQREITAFLKLANAEPAQLAQFRKDMANALPLFLKQVEAAKKNPQAIMAYAETAYTNLKLSFWEVIGPGLLKFIQSLTKLINAIGNLPPATRKLMAFTALLASMAAAVVLLAGIFKSAILTLGMTGVSKIAGAIGTTGITPRAAAAMSTAQLLQAASAHTGIPAPVPASARIQARGPNGRFLSYAQTPANTRNLAGAAGMASGPGLFTRLGTSFASLSKSIGSTLVIVLKFLGIGALLYGFFKGLYQALQATLLPALSSVGIKFIGLGDIFAWVKDKLDILANFVGFVFVSIISTVQSVFAVLINVVQLIAESFTWLWHNLKGLFTWGKTPKYTSTGFADIWADFKNTMTGGIFKENDKAYWDLLINPKTPPSGERAWKPTTPSSAGANDLGTSAISNTAFGAAGASKYFEAGTSAGYEALITANSAMITVLEKLRGDVNSRLDTTNDLLESNNGLLSGDTTRVEE